MSSNRWLKSSRETVPAEEPAGASAPAKNVSMSEVRRIAQQKAKRALEPDETAPTHQNSGNNTPETSASGQGVRPPMSPLGGQTPSPSQTLAPARNFNRRANSLEFAALPSGLFPGTSKNVYDAIYVRTVGAVVPTRTITATKKEVSIWSNIKNRKTLDAHLRYFDMVGLLKRQWVPGQNDGYKFTIYLPEEIGQGVRPPEMVTPLDGSDHFLVRGSDQKMGSGGQTQVVESKDGSRPSKTSYKTNTERERDDEAFTAMCSALKQATKELTGREPTSSDNVRCAEVADVLVTELRIAAARTTVSSAPSFLAEHLRRRLFKKDAKAMKDESKAGETDASPSATGIDASKCQDCGGSGWWYPEGTEKGVAKCRHEKLANTAQSDG